MPWQAEAPAGGFTTGRPWLPSDAAHRTAAVDRQQADPGSTLQLTRRVLALRRAHPALRLGGFETLHADDALLLLRRTHGADVVLAAFNLGALSATQFLPPATPDGVELLSLNGARREGGLLQLPPGAAWIGCA
jgi:alpha-glucosidase